LFLIRVINNFYNEKNERRIFMKLVKVVKIGSILLSVAGMIGSAWAGSQENKLELEKLVNDHFNK
jgi:hypothetical protein